MILQDRWIAKRRSLGIAVFGALLLSSLGCGRPHGVYQADPAMGNFNRPITWTPPVFAGGDPGMSPAYDTGARLGMASPDVPDMSMGNGGARAIWLAPTYGAGSGGGLLGMFSNSAEKNGGGAAIVPTGGGGSRVLPNLGARLQGTQESKPLIAPTNNNSMPNASSVTFREKDPTSMFTSGSAIVPPGAAKQTQVVTLYQQPNEPSKVKTVEEGQVMLASYGIKWQRLEQIENGQWMFTASKGTNPTGTADRRYESRHQDQVEAVRAVLEQVRTEK